MNRKNLYLFRHMSFSLYVIASVTLFSSLIHHRTQNTLNKHHKFCWKFLWQYSRQMSGEIQFKHRSRRGCARMLIVKSKYFIFGSERCEYMCSKSLLFWQSCCVIALIYFRYTLNEDKTNCEWLCFVLSQ